MLIPSRRLLKLLGLLVVAGLVTMLAPSYGYAWIGLAGGLAVVGLIDALRLPRSPLPDARRLIPGSLAVGVRRDAVIRVVNTGDAPISLELYDHHPQGIEAIGLPQRVRLAGNEWTELRYQMRPVERGDQRFGTIEARVDSALGLWQMRRRLGVEDSVRVYPNFAALTKYALLATDHRLSQIGILQRRRRGEGLDFHQLREYRLGDSLRAIDWKATSRTAKLISREYQDERDQRVVFLLDCGRRMAAQDGALSHFDHMLNAALLLAYVGLRQGDAVGLLTMASEPAQATRYLAPRKSAGTVSTILNAVYDLAPTLATPDYYRAALELSKRVTKRALVVILTNLRDEDDVELLPALRLLRGRHLVVLASLREQILGDALARPVHRFEDALTHAATASYLSRRAANFARLEQHGAICLDVEPQDLAVSLVNRYLDVKRSGRL